MRPAGEDPQTQTSLAAHQAGALRWLIGGVMALVVAVLLGVAAVAIAGNTGRRVPIAGVAVVALFAIGLIAVGAGVGALTRTVRWRRALAATVWQDGRLRVAGPAVMAFEPAGYDELDPTDEPVRLRLLSTAMWRTRTVQGLDGSEVRAAPIGRGQWVLTADGLGTVFGAQVVRRRT